MRRTVDPEDAEHAAQDAYEDQYRHQTARARRQHRCHHRETRMITPTLTECVDCHTVITTD